MLFICISIKSVIFLAKMTGNAVRGTRATHRAPPARGTLDYTEVDSLLTVMTLSRKRNEGNIMDANVHCRTSAIN